MDERQIERLLSDIDCRVTPPDDIELRALARRAAGPRPIAPRVRPLRLRWAVAVAGALLLGSGFGFGLSAWNTPEGSAGTRFVGLGFLPAKGWTVVQSEAAGPTAARAIAANVPLHPDDDLSAPPSATLESLPENGIVIFATFTTRGDPAEADFARRELPLSIKRARVVAPSVGSLHYSLRASVGAYNVDARIYFGTASPSAETINAAQIQLNRLVVASERVTILARPTVLGRGQRLMLFGSVDSDKAEEIVTIEVKDCGQSSFHGVAAVRTREGGGWSTDFVNPGITATLRAVWRDSTSAPVTVQVTPYVQLRRLDGSSSRFAVWVSGKVQFWRRHVVIERFDRRLGSWKAVQKVVLTATASTPGYPSVSSYEKFKVSVPKGSLIRAVFPRSQARPCYLAGYSQLVRT